MRHKHTLSHYKLLTGDMGVLYPVGLVEVLPGDAFQHNASVFLRMSPMAAPVMHPIDVRIHHFFYAHRLGWPTDGATGWESFITGGTDGNDAQNPPTVNTALVEDTLHDYFGLPNIAGMPVSALPYRCYNAIFNEFYRDQNLVTEVAEDSTALQKIAWQKDMFTVSRPWTQLGDAVTLPLGSKAPVHGIGSPDNVYGVVNNVYETGAAGTDNWTKALKTNVDNFAIEEDPDNTGFPGIFADLSAAGAIDINDFRRAFALQRFKEARARYGARYTEYLRYLGVQPSDARLQRPEYLGGGKVRVSTSEVLQTANEAASDRFGVGDLYGHGVAAMRSNKYRRHFNEHGYIMSLLSVRPKSMYTQGIPRTFLQRDKEDFWQRELQQIGQQEVWDGELWSDTGDGVAEMYGTFGYGDRYRQYKEQPSSVCGEFRNVLDYWHLGRSFAARPVLNQSFTDCSPSKRIFNIQVQHTLWMAVQHHLVARRLVRKGNASRIL